MNRELYHHGILGQKWGKRNGPPYPIAPGDHSASEKKAGYRKSIEKKSIDKDKLKKYAKYGVIACGVALATVGTYKLAQSGKLDGLSSKGRTVFENLTGNIPTISTIQPKEPKKLSSNETPKSVSEAFSDLANSPLKKADNVENNCTNVFLAAVGRMRGLAVTPGCQKDSTGEYIGLKTDDVANCFKNRYDAKGNDMVKDVTAKFAKNWNSQDKVARNLMSKYPEGSYGYISGIFQFKQPGTGRVVDYDHGLTWQISNGKVVFGDGINGLIAGSYFKNLKVEETYSRQPVIRYFRADDHKLNMSEYLKHVNT